VKAHVWLTLHGEGALQEKGIELHEGVKIVAVEGQHLLLDSQQPEAYDECLWCTQALAPGWLQQTDLTLGRLGLPSPLCCNPIRCNS